MKKGRFGFLLSCYAILAFICVILKLPLLCALTLFAAIFLEKDEWAARQCLQAFLLSLTVSLFGDMIPWVISSVPLSFVSDFLSAVSGVFSVLVYMAAIVFSILGIVRTMKGQEANLPLYADAAWSAYGKRKPKPIPGPYPPQYHPADQPGQAVPPVYQAPSAQPFQSPNVPGPQTDRQQPLGPENDGSRPM